MPSKRDQIISATRDLILENGLQDISMSQIAQRAEVGMGTIYNYFASKEDLVYRLYYETKAAMSQYVLGNYDRDQPVVVRFLQILTRIAHYGVQYPNEFRLVEILSKVPFIQEQTKHIEQPLTATFQQIFVDAQHQQLLKDMPLTMIELLISGALYTLIEAHVTGQIRLNDALIQQTVSACWDAVKR
jgi:TetR/AcrR family transcriptional regulator, repressor of fatR-cypB operon